MGLKLGVLRKHVAVNEFAVEMVALTEDFEAKIPDSNVVRWEPLVRPGTGMDPSDNDLDALVSGRAQVRRNCR
jgi:hypothetical protein